MAPGFAGVLAFLRGSDMLATAPSLLRFGLFRWLASAPSPVPRPTMPMFMIWRRRDHDDPPHRRIRAEVEAVAKPVTATARQDVVATPPT